MTAAEYKNHLFNPKTDKHLLFAYIKQEGDYEKIHKIIKSVSTHPFVTSLLKNSVKVANIADLRKGKLIPYGNSFIGEASLLAFILERNSEMIAKFISLKEAFDNSFINSDFNESERILGEVQDLCGYSLWLFESQILLNEHRDGTKENWNYVSELSKVIKDPLTLFQIENISKRAEIKISYFRYINIFNSQVDEDFLGEKLYEFLCLRLNYLQFSRVEELPYFLFMEGNAPLVDRYLLFKEVLAELAVSKATPLKDEANYVLQKLHNLFPLDVQIHQLCALTSSALFKTLPSNTSLDSLIEQFTVANYDDCIKQSLELINKEPFSLEAYEIFVKASIESNAPIPIGVFSPLKESILKILFNVYSNIESTEFGLEAGLKLCSSFISSRWSRQLLSLLNSSTSNDNGNQLFSVQYVTNSRIRNPRTLYFVSEMTRGQYINTFDQSPQLANTIKIHNDIINGSYVEINGLKGISDNRRNQFYGRALMSASEYDRARVHFLRCLEGSNNQLLKEEYLVNLFTCCLRLSSLKDACILFVNNHLENRGLTKRFNYQILLSRFESEDLSAYQDLIHIPIFFEIASNDSYQQYVAYDNFLESKGHTRPTELLSSVEFHDQLNLYFFKEVCTIEIMHHSYHFDSTEDLENERLNILNVLLVADQKNEDEYIKEITELHQNGSIRKAMREVNKGRISVNVQQLKNNEVNNVKEAYYRYREIEVYTKVKGKDIVGIDSTLMLDDLQQAIIDEYVPNKIVYTSDPAFISFKVIFLEIRDKFILSKEYGLDGYLSTRIRHGTLLNHIRSIFESENIVSQRNKDNQYLESVYWNERIPYQLVDKADKIQTAIKHFSRAIDEYTELIVKELIQVKSEKNQKKPRALFDYSLSNNELAVLFAFARQNILDHNQFLTFVFEYLQLFTERLLNKIRTYVNTEIKDRYYQLLADFNTDVKQIVGNYGFPDLLSAISLCGTRLQNELKAISEWFYLSNTSKDLSLDLKVLVQTAVQITNTIYPHSKLNPHIVEMNEHPMVGTIHFIYVCRILLDNIIQHSKLSASELQVEISWLQTQEDTLEISFKNNLSQAIDLAALNKRFETIKTKWDESSSDYENIDVEGGSGFDKIRRIFAFDLNSQHFKFDYKIEDRYLIITLGIELLDVPEFDQSV